MTTGEISVGILGAGRSGLSAARLARRLGARVLMSESGPRLPKLPSGAGETGGHSRRLLAMDLLIRSPGIHNDLPLLEAARRRGIPILSEIELAGRYAQPRQLIAITGTNGKTTTTTLVGALFKAAGRQRTWVGGNIGTPYADLALRVGPRDTVVLEVSSYQLENIEHFHPTIAACLNLTPDHLEHHGSMRAYAAAKSRLFLNQTRGDVAVLNADDPWCRRAARRCKGQIFFFSRKRLLKSGVSWLPSPALRASSPLGGGMTTKSSLSQRERVAEPGEGRSQGNIVIRWGKTKSTFPLVTHLPGAHNVENILAAVAMAVAGGVPVPVIRRVLARFRGVEHRLEAVRTLDGVRYVNDSKGTNVDSTRVALASFTEPLIVILGGQGKGSPYAPLKPLLRQRARRLLLIGEDAPRIRRELKPVAACESVKTMDRAVRRARQLARPGEVVLLSPACASFDQYRNYEERGRHFKTLVRHLR